MKKQVKENNLQKSIFSTPTTRFHFICLNWCVDQTMINNILRSNPGIRIWINVTIIKYFNNCYKTPLREEKKLIFFIYHNIFYLARIMILNLMQKLYHIVVWSVEFLCYMNKLFKMHLFVSKLSNALSLNPYNFGNNFKLVHFCNNVGTRFLIYIMIGKI